MSPPVLEVCHVDKLFPDGTIALQQVSFCIEPGETFIFIGESGSGKTTLLRLLIRLDEPSAGEIFYRGRSIQTEDSIVFRRRLGYVQQDGGLLPHWTVARNIGLVPMLLGWDALRQRSRVDTLLELVGLAPARYRNRYPSELSGGQRQRVAFARALAAEPEVVLLDEPFGALDALTRYELQEEFLSLKHMLQQTMILVTHDIQEAFRLGDRIAIMRHGQIIQMGSPAQLLHHPANAYVEAFLQHRQGAWLR
ncbi:MAG: ATP-binding cassette domain-containing protein [Nitrospirales bacterium]|nr:ATP-binding cassette domain-containing protein [Nitrospirales bacterium]